LLTLCAALALAVFSSCGDTEDDPAPAVQSYTVTFNANGGSAVASQTVTEGAKITEPTPAPTQTGKTFAGWYKVAFNTKWNFATDVVVSDITLHAKWANGENLPSYTVTFNTNDGSAIAPQTIVQGEPAQKPPNPTKAGHIFDAWYKEAELSTPWNFASDTVSADTTLYAKWKQTFTVTFNTNGGSAIPPVTRGQGSEVYLPNYRPTKSGALFDGWYTDTTLSQLADSSIYLNENITLYAKWIPSADVAPYAGVWQSSGGGWSNTYILKDDGTGFSFFSGDGISWHTIAWSTSQIDGDSASFSETSVTIEGQGTYTKNTGTKTPAKADSLLGVWASSGRTIEFKADGSAEADGSGETISLKYRVEGNTLFLLYPTANTVILSIPISGGAPQGLSRPTSVESLAGIWKLMDEGGQNYYYTLAADGKGTFTTLGVSIQVSFVVTEERIGDSPYTIEGDTLTLNSGWEREVTYTKITGSIPQESGADGDSRLYGAWVIQGSPQVMTFNSNGTGTQAYNGSEADFIWKANGSTLTLYISNFSEGMAMPYTVSGSTLTVEGGKGQEMVLTKK
jgi:uncharacterized repeat protein (TIGR02543 family)